MKSIAVGPLRSADLSHVSSAWEAQIPQPALLQKSAGFLCRASFGGSKYLARDFLEDFSDMSPQVEGKMASSKNPQEYRWGQKDDLPNGPNLYSRQIISGNSMCFMCTKENF